MLGISNTGENILMGYARAVNVSRERRSLQYYWLGLGKYLNIIKKMASEQPFIRSVT